MGVCRGKKEEDIEGRSLKLERESLEIFGETEGSF